MFSPVSEAEVEGLLRAAAAMRQRLRPAGGSLSPNGLGLSHEGMLSMALMDKVRSGGTGWKEGGGAGAAALNAHFSVASRARCPS